MRFTVGRPPQAVLLLSSWTAWEGRPTKTSPAPNCLKSIIGDAGLITSKVSLGKTDLRKAYRAYEYSRRRLD